MEVEFAWSPHDLGTEADNFGGDYRAIDDGGGGMLDGNTKGDVGVAVGLGDGVEKEVLFHWQSDYGIGFADAYG